MNQKKFEEQKGYDLIKIEEAMLLKWEAEHTFQHSIALKKNAPSFVFYEGPPSANGLPGIHHVISRTIKDLFCRYKTMKGYRVERRGGWDTHGLPIELSVEKKMKITKKDIGNKVSVEEYNKACREEVLRYKKEWDALTKRIAYWVDLENPYVTFENNYIESVWWSLKELYKQEKLYKDISIQPYSPAAGSGLSSHELNQPGTYKMVKDTSIVALFEVIDNAESSFLYQKIADHKVYMMAWTTTPWTLPSNIALAVNCSFLYVQIDTCNPYTNEKISVVVAKDLLATFFNNEENKIWNIIQEMKGEQLLALRYHQLIPLPANNPSLLNGDAFRVIHSNHVNLDAGTGIVHMAPAFGVDDYKACKQQGMGFICLVDKEGKFVDGMGEYSNRFVKNYREEKDYQDPNIDICVDLKKNGKAFLIQKYEHSYPHCWRTDKPILYYPLDAWFISVASISEKLAVMNKTINWKPNSTGEGRFGNWLLTAEDWNLSRSRFWGTPLPIWRTEDGVEAICIGSIEELTKAYLDAVKKGMMMDSFPLKGGRLDMDLHKPYIDNIILVSASGKPMYREADLIDVWYDSGAMPFAQLHYPFENQEIFTKNFPADFICEGIDQTRGWFYTLHVLGVLLFDQPAFRNVISNGLVLDKNGNKMSKRLGNAVDPNAVIQRFGADATRWYMMTSSSPWENMRFDVESIGDVQSKLYSTLYNTYNFFAMYAILDGFTYAEEKIPVSERTELDRWIISELQTLLHRYHQTMDDYEPMAVHRDIIEFVNDRLSNWYVRLSRRRFWKDSYNRDKIMAFQTLYECLLQLSQMMAPLSPLFADWLFRLLNSVTQHIHFSSVHHTLLPEAIVDCIDEDLQKKMQFAQEICSLALSIRKQQNIKVRQPLQTLLVSIHDETMARYLDETNDIIKHEINVKEIKRLESNSNIITKKVKPNFKILGKKYGNKMQLITTAIQSLSASDIQDLENKKTVSLQINDGLIHIALDEVEITTTEIQGWSCVRSENSMVALDLNITDELRHEGIAREMINRIQHLRKKENLNLTDRIEISIFPQSFLEAVIDKYKVYICNEVLASRVDMISSLNSNILHEIELDGQTIKLAIKKIN